jgi:hypothetical protein
MSDDKTEQVFLSEKLYAAMNDAFQRYESAVKPPKELTALIEPELLRKILLGIFQAGFASGVLYSEIEITISTTATKN